MRRDLSCLAASAFMLLSTTVAAAGADYGQVDATYSMAPIAGWICEPGLAMSPLPDDSVLVGLVNGSDGGGAIARVRPDGILESRWQGGVALLPGSDGAGAPTSILPLPSGGAIVVRNGSLTRLRPDGTVDTSYGAQGVGGAEMDFIESAALQADGSVVVYGYFVLFGTHWSFQRVSSDGKTSDTLQQVDLAPFDSLYAWSVLDNGSVEVGTIDYSQTPARPILRRFPDNFAVGDSPGGRVMPHAGVASWVGPTVQVDGAGGAVFALSSVLGGFPGVQLVRYLADGSIDGGFGLVPATPYNSFELHATLLATKLWRSGNGNWTAILDVNESDGAPPAPINTGFSFVVGFGADGKPDPTFPANQAIVGDSRDIRLNTGKLMAASPNNGNCQLERIITDDEPRVDGILVEYFHPVLRHYFLTLDTFEAAGLDANPASGWARTGRTFAAWQPVPAPATTAVCRFYGDPVIGPNSHFYTPEGPECDALIALEQATPPGLPAWHLEAKPFRVSLPSGDGTCPGNLDPVYRVFNGPVDNAHGPTHRYTTDPALYAQMQSLGWLPEGVHFCVPPLGPR